MASLFSFKKFVALVVVLLFFLVCFITYESPGVVDWRSLRGIAFESDDWGLAGFVPRSDIWQGHNREDLSPGKFPEVYWESTLEDSLMVANLCKIMASVKGADGLSAVFQPNYVMSSLSYEKGPEGWVWKRYDLPQFPPTYERPGMWDAVQQGISSGVWYPEYHATWHYDPAMRLESALQTDFSVEMAKAGVTLFPGSEFVRELGPWRSKSNLKDELAHSQTVFKNSFGRPMGAIIAPDYTWDDRCEKLWQEMGVFVIQAKREQRNPSLHKGLSGRVEKFIKRQWAVLTRGPKVYLERNCRLEPVQAPDADLVVQTCVNETYRAWEKGSPAIVETHRVNFAHDDPKIVQLGQNALNSYVQSVCDDVRSLPVFLVDKEISQLQTRGVSWVIRGNSLVLRNATHSRRLVFVDHQKQSRWFILAKNSVYVTKW